MARRRGRGRFNRINPDMGWWVDQGSMEFGYVAPIEVGTSLGTAESIMQFQDITDDDSLVLRDNSDWFIKRCIIEAYPRFETTGTTGNSTNDTRRLYTLSVGTIDNDKLAEWVVNQPHTLFEPGGYEMWARMLRTYNRALYAEFNPYIITGAPGTGSQLVATSEAGTPRFRAGMPTWGQTHVSDDFTVSNAGLKPEQSVAIGVSILNPGGGLWEDGEYLTLFWTLRLLLQKRRAA